MIPGRVGRGVRLGSESSSGGGGAGGVWKSGNLEVWEFGDLGIWGSGELEIQNFGNLGTWKSWNLGPKIEKKNNTKIQIRSAKMSARSGLVGKNPPGPIWGHLRPFFPWTGKIQNLPKKCLFFWTPPIKNNQKHSISTGNTRCYVAL